MDGEPDFDLSRREFMMVGTTSMLGLQSGAIQPQVDSGDNPKEEYAFQGVADLMGPADARPAPGDPFFDNKQFYAYRYETTDTGSRYIITQDDATWSEIPMPIDKYTTPYDALKTAQQYTQFALDPSKGLTRRRYHWYSANTLFGDTNFVNNDARGTITATTGSSGASTARVQSAISGQYIAQSLAQPGVGVELADGNVSRSNGLVSLSHGTAAVGVGWHDRSAGGWGVGGPVQTFLGIRYTPNGAFAELISNGQRLGDAPVAQDQWNLDTMDGSGDGNNPSGLTLRPEDGYVYQFPYTWYGHGALYVGVSHPQTEDVLLFHKFDLPRTSFDRPNMAPMLILDDGGTAADLRAELGGLQYAVYGSNLSEEGPESRGTEVTRTQFSISTQSVDNNDGVDPVAEPGEPVISFRRVSGVRDIALSLQSVFAEVDNPLWVFSWDEYEPGTALTNQNFRNPNESVYPSDETYIQVDTAATDYSPTTAVSRGIDFIYTGKNQESLTQLATDDRIPIDATRVITAAHEGTSVNVDPAQIRVVEGF